MEKVRRRCWRDDDAELKGKRVHCIDETLENSKIYLKLFNNGFEQFCNYGADSSIKTYCKCFLVNLLERERQRETERERETERDRERQRERKRERERETEKERDYTFN